VGTHATVGAALTTYGTGRHCQTVRVRQAVMRRCTRRTAGGSPVTLCGGSNLTDMGRCAARGWCRWPGAGQLRSRFRCRWEARSKDCGVAVAMLSGSRWTPPSSINSVVNVGTTRARPPTGHPVRLVGRSVADRWLWAGRRSGSSPSTRELYTQRRGPAGRQEGR
jgi:hypothetical protein